MGGTEGTEGSGHTTHKQEAPGPRRFGNFDTANVRLVDGCAGSCAVSREVQGRGGFSSAYDIAWGCDLLSRPMQKRFEAEVLNGATNAVILAPP